MGATIAAMTADAASPDPIAFAIAGSNRTRARNKLKEERRWQTVRGR
jgi:hypothetical protein